MRWSRTIVCHPQIKHSALQECVFTARPQKNHPFNEEILTNLERNSADAGQGQSLCMRPLMPLFKICNISLRCKKYIGLIFFLGLPEHFWYIFGKFPKIPESFQNFWKASEIYWKFSYFLQR